MRIVQINPGTGGSFYCQNCLRDSILAKQMAKLAHDVLVVPLYLPLGVDVGQRIDDLPIFFGGINVYLQQKSGLFRRTPRWIDRLFDSKSLLRWAGRRVGMTTARQLGQTTVSMLLAEQGRQKKELARLLRWLGEQPKKPDLLCLSNILLAGLVPGIKDQLNVPVVSLLQDEDAFLDALPPPYSQQAWELLAELSTYVDGFIAVSRYFAQLMQEKLSIPEDRMHVVPLGICPQRYKPPPASPAVPTLGYLSRMCPERGLDTLLEAFAILKAKESLKHARLRILGGATVSDRAFVNQIKQNLRRQGLLEDVDFLRDFDWPERAGFLNSLSVLCVPEKQPVAAAIYVLEAWAAAVPVVQPDIGAFSELLAHTDAGLLYEPSNVRALAQALETLLADPQRARAMGKRGRDAVARHYNIERTAQKMLQIFDNLQPPHC